MISVIPVVGDFAAYQPVITVLSEGTSLTVQATISNDRRFVRLTVLPFFSQYRRRAGILDFLRFQTRRGKGELRRIKNPYCLGR